MESPNINISHQIAIYKELMHSLVFETKDRKSEKKVLKDKALSLLARGILEINGDDEFKKKINSDVDMILSVKPGRILFKALTLLNQKIRVSKGVESHFNNELLEIFISHASGEYATMGGGSVPYLSCSDLLHELIHVYHKLVDPDEYNFKNLRDLKSLICVIKDMNNLEEQDTIIALWFGLSLSKTLINKIDVVCENAFLFAFGLPPRINHLSKGHFPKDANMLKTMQIQPTLEAYYAWLEWSLTITNYALIYHSNPSISPLIPENLQNDISFMYALFVKEPALIKFFPEFRKNTEFMMALVKENYSATIYYESELRKETDFMLQVFKSKPELIKHFPSFRSDANFMLSIIKVNPLIVFDLEEDDLKDKVFVLKCLYLLSEDPTCDVFKSTFCDKIHRSLWSDPEIQKFDPIFALKLRHQEIFGSKMD